MLPAYRFQGLLARLGFRFSVSAKLAYQCFGFPLSTARFKKSAAFLESKLASLSADMSLSLSPNTRVPSTRSVDCTKVLLHSWIPRTVTQQRTQFREVPAHEAKEAPPQWNHCRQNTGIPAKRLSVQSYRVWDFRTAHMIRRFLVAVAG